MLFLVAEDLSKYSRENFEGPKRINEQQSRLSSEIHKHKKNFSAPRFDESYPLEKERNLLAALRRGDQETARGILNELLGLIFFSHSGNFEYIKFKSIELLVLLSRAVMENSEEDQTQEEAQGRYLRALLEAENLEELTDLLNRIVERLSIKIFTFHRVKHASALRKAERYVRNNYSRRLSLSEVARAAELSPAYFSTLFKQEMGEGFSDYLARLRIEKATLLLLKTNLGLPEIASQCGFEDQSWFSKTFKKFMRLSPGKYREMGGDWAPKVEEIHEG
jgi:YesN/AraC family two-component response regulator